MISLSDSLLAELSRIQVGPNQDLEFDSAVALTLEAATNLPEQRTREHSTRWRSNCCSAG